jgi:hypothetical protein
MFLIIVYTISPPLIYALIDSDLDFKSGYVILPSWPLLNTNGNTHHNLVKWLLQTSNTS